MNAVSLDLGLYVNVFRVTLPDQRVEVMQAASSGYPSLKGLREEIAQAGWQARVYRLNEWVIGYGRDMQKLSAKSFQPQEVRLLDHPMWCARLIKEGLSDHLKGQGYREQVGKVRTTLYEPEPYGTAAEGQLRVFRGYDVNTICFMRDHSLIFGLIIDISWEIQDSQGQRLGTPAIAQYNAVGEVAQIQDEYLCGNRINSEVSRLRLQKHILPFVRQNREFTLPLSEEITVTLEEAPLRIILGV